MYREITWCLDYLAKLCLLTNFGKIIPFLDLNSKLSYGDPGLMSWLWDGCGRDAAFWAIF